MAGVSQSDLKFDIRIQNMPLLRSTLKKYILEHKKFERQVKDTFRKQANDLRRLAAMYAPRDKGVLDKPRINSKQYQTAGGFGRNTYITFVPEYAAWLEFFQWGPARGRPWRPGTFAKRSRTGAPIGPRYAGRALADFSDAALKTKIVPFGKNFGMRMVYHPPDILGTK